MKLILYLMMRTMWHSIVKDISNLEYTERVFAESMRLYPPAWAIGRQAMNDCKIGDYVIPAGSSILMSQYLMHHDPRYFPQPERFDPERWNPQEKAKRPRFHYFPFGGGLRSCIGEPFAWMEGILVIATIARRWKMQSCQDILLYFSHLSPYVLSMECK